MIDLSRHHAASRSRDVRAVLCAAVALGAIALTWRGLRPALIDWVGRSSLGCGRARLVVAALRQKHSDLPSDDQLIPDYVNSSTGTSSSYYYPPHVASWANPPPGWLAWEFVRETIQHGAARQDKWGFTVADANLEIRGSVGSPINAITCPAGDFDGDGHWELVLSYQATPWQEAKQHDVWRWAVIRCMGGENQVLQVGLTDYLLWSNSNTRIKPIWRDEDGDGIMELVFVTLTIRRVPQGVAADPPTTVAVFEWTGPGGVLRPRLLPDDAGIISWTPPTESPVIVESSEDMEAALAGLFPVPDGFGLQPATSPAAGPSD